MRRRLVASGGVVGVAGSSSSVSIEPTEPLYRPPMPMRRESLRTRRGPPRRTSSPIKKGEKPRSFFPTSKRKKEAAFFPPPSKVERKRQRKKKSKSPPPLSLSLYQHKRKTERCDHSGESLEESLRTSRNRINR